MSIPPGVAHAAAPLDIAEQMERARLAEQHLDYDVAAELWLEIVASKELSSRQRLEVNLSAGRVARVRGQDLVVLDAPGLKCHAQGAVST